MGALSDKDILFVMLGTNDILLTDHPDANRAVQKMAKLLDWIKAEDPVFETIVIGPVPISVEPLDMQIYHDESLRMNLGFKSVCEERGVACYDAADWDIRLTYGGDIFRRRLPGFRGADHSDNKREDGAENHIIAVLKQLDQMLACLPDSTHLKASAQHNRY